MSRYYDRDGQPINLKQWIHLFSDEEYQRVALTETSEWRISTVWLGLDHSLFGTPPLIFETMVFGGPCDQDQWRYPTLSAAIAGHEHAVIETVKRIEETR